MAVLQLITTTKAPAPECVDIDGTDYPISSPQDLTVINLRRLERLGWLLSKPDVTDEESREASRLLDLVCRAVLQTAPAELHDALSEAHRFLVLQAFTTLRPNPTTRQPTGAKRTRRPSTGGRSRRGSRGSMAAETRKAG